MKKLKILLFILLIIIIGVVIFVMFNQKKSNKEVKKAEPDIKEPYKHTKTIEDNYGESGGVEIKYDQYIVASGYMGASDNVYYTRNNDLYHLIVSSNKTTKIATGIKKIEKGMDTINAYKDNNFKIIEEDNYITYVD